MKKIKDVQINKESGEMEIVKKNKPEKQEKQQKEKKPRMLKLIIILSLAALVLAAAAVLYVVLQNDIKYAMADSKLEKGDEMEARQMFLELESFEDSPTRVLMIDYSSAVRVMDSGEYATAIPMFEALGGYSDSADKITKCYLQIAEELFEGGDYENSRANFETANSSDGIRKTDIAWGDELYAAGSFAEATEKWQPYSGSSEIDQRIADADYELTIIAANEGDYNAVIKANTLNYDERAAQASEALLTMPKETLVSLSASDNHIAFIASDGIVHASGENSHGQCDVEEWQGVVSLCLSSLNTYGIKFDGSVLAAGSNTFNQCDVSSWKDIVSLAATDNAVFGLTSGGKVLYAGGVEGWYDAVSEWSDIVQIAAGMEHAAALDKSGNVFAAGKNHYEQVDISEETDTVSIACGPLSTVLIKADGSVNIIGVYDAFENYDTLSGASEISASWSHIVIRNSNGDLIAYGINKRGQCNVSDWQDVLLFTAKSGFTVGVKTDGSVINTVEGHTLNWQILIWN